MTEVKLPEGFRLSRYAEFRSAPEDARMWQYINGRYWTAEPLPQDVTDDRAVFAVHISVAMLPDVLNPPPYFARCSRAYWERCRLDDRRVFHADSPAWVLLPFDSEHPGPYACRLPEWVEFGPPPEAEICTLPEAQVSRRMRYHYHAGAWIRGLGYDRTSSCVMTLYAHNIEEGQA